MLLINCGLWILILTDTTCIVFIQIKNRDEMEKRTETGLVMGHAYGITAVKKVSRIIHVEDYIRTCTLNMNQNLPVN